MIQPADFTVHHFYSTIHLNVIENAVETHFFCTINEQCSVN